MKKLTSILAMSSVCLSATAFASSENLMVVDGGIVHGYISNSSFGSVEYSDISIALTRDTAIPLKGEFPSRLEPASYNNAFSVDLTSMTYDEDNYSNPLVYGIVNADSVFIGCEFSFNRFGNVKALGINASDSSCVAEGQMLKIALHVWNAYADDDGKEG